MQTQTSNTFHNAIMEAGSKDRPPMLAPGNYVQWKSRIKRYINTKPNHELIHHCLKNPPYKFTWADKEVLISEGSPVTRTESYMETYKTVSQDIRDQLNAEAEAVQIILTGIYNDIYSTVDACSNACEMWKAIERFYKMMNELIKNQCDVTNHQVNVQFLLQLQPEWQRANQDNSLRINRSTGYENQRIGNVAGARETIGSTVVQKSGIQCYNCKEFGHVARECQKPKRAKDASYHREKMLLCKQEEAGIQLNAEQADWRDDTDDELEDQELEAHYMYMAKLQEVSPDADDSGPIFDAEPLQKVSNNDYYNVFAIESEHTEQSESIHDTYPIKQDEHNVIIDSLYMSYDREQIDHNDDDNNLANERELLASLIEKLKCEIDESKNRNKFLETSNKVLIEKLKGEIEDFKNKNKILESTNNRFKEANNKLSDTNNLLYTDFKKSQAELARRNDVEYASKKEAQIKLYKTCEDKELDKVIALENKVKVLYNIVYKTGQSVQTMNMLNNKGRTSFAKPEFLKKAQRANPCLYDIERSRLSHTSVNNGNSKESFNKQTTLLEKRMDESIPWDKKCKSSIELFKIKTYVDTIFDGVERCKETIARRTYSGYLDPFIPNTIEANFSPEIRRINAGLEQFHMWLNEEIVADLRYFNSLELEVDSLRSQLETQKTQFLNEIDRLSREYYYADYMNAILGVYTELDEDLKAQLQDKGIVISELKKLIEKLKGKSVDTKMYKLHTEPTQARTSQLPQDSRKTNKRVSFSTGVIPTTNVSRPQLQSNPMEDRVMLNNSKGNKQEVEDHHRNFKFSKNKTSVTACNDSLNATTLNVNFVCATCVASESNQKPRNITRKLYEHVSKACIWWYPKFTPSGYKWKPKSDKENVNPNLVEIVLFIVDSGCSKHMTGNLKLLINFVEKFLGTVKFGNDQIAPILGYGNLVQGAVTIKRVYYVEGLNHNLFSGNDLLTATSSQAWLWHRRLSHLNFDTINLLSMNDIVVGLPKLKFVKDHLCSSCELGKAKRKYTWTHFLRSKDETPEVLIDFLKLVQIGLHAQVRIVRTDKGTEFLNQTLHAYFVAEGILHQTSVARTPEQNGVVKRRNHTLVEAARTMLSAAKSRAYRVFNKRTRVIMKTIHANFDELPQITSDHVSSNPGPKCQGKALEHDSLSLGPQCKDNVTQAEKTVTTSNELDFLFSLMFDELLNGSSKVVSKSSAVASTDAPNQRQQHHTTLLNNPTRPDPICQVPTLAPTVTSTENIHQAEIITENSQGENDEFINIFCTPVQDRGETSSHHVDSLNMHTFYQHHTFEHPWTKDLPLEQVIGNPSQSVRTRRQLELDGEICMFALTFDRLDVWELVDRPLCKNVINMKWLCKNKCDEENTVIRNKSRLVAKGYAQKEGVDYKESFAPVARL
uniref:CCHC-type domain-containing protein n=1 Tax=Tanacetum cinerariifolium TaxID=118510 RepID=A0A699GSS6_TANCI|nr:hypothetical protein [Tanacetum cinerariifolium]